MSSPFGHRWRAREYWTRGERPVTPGPPALAAADAGGELGERERFRQAVLGADG